MSLNTSPVFAYGTLLDNHIQLEVFGRLLTGVPDQLYGFVLRQRAVAATYPDIFPSPGSDSRVSGMRLELQPEELLLADTYETDLYTREWVTLDSGTEAWVYMGAGNNPKISNEI